MRTVIIDDEDAAGSLLQVFLKDLCPEVEVVAIANSAKSGKAIIEEHNPELVFLDVMMPGGSGFDLISSLENISFQVIFTTGHDEFAVQAFKVSALDYLLKPIDPDDLQQAVSKAINNRKETQSDSLKTLFQEMNKQLKADPVALPTMEGMIFVQPDEIICCNADGGYTEIILQNDKKVLISKNIGQIEKKLGGKSFYRVHHSHLINLRHIREYVRSGAGYILMSNGSHINISRRKREEFINLFESS